MELNGFGSIKLVILKASLSVILNFDDDGTIEVRLGDETGTVIAKFTPEKVGNWDQYQTVYIGIDDIVGVHAVTFVAKEGQTILNFAWFELSDFPKRSKVHACIAASEYSDQRGTSLHGPNTSVGWFDKDNYMTYSSVNFGQRGTTSSLDFNYTKGNNGGGIEILMERLLVNTNLQTPITTGMPMKQ